MATMPGPSPDGPGWWPCLDSGEVAPTGDLRDPREPPGEPATIWTPGGGPKMSTFGQHPGGQTPRADMRPPKGVKMTQK